jgi:pimeloyl-ACP methyl ester carboxylesterase
MSPSDVGLTAHDLEFEVSDRATADRLKIVGWWIAAPAESTQTVVIIHGYADSRIGALAWTPLWLAAGYNALIVDLRAHGESGGTFTTAGLRERFDLEQVVAQIRQRKPLETRHLMLFGVSMGAAVALSAAEITPDIAGVVVDSPVADFYHGAATQLWLMGLPGKIVLRPGLWLAEALIGGRFSSIRPADVIGRLDCPVLALTPADDPFLPADQAARIESTIKKRQEDDQISQFLTFEGATHLLPLYFDAAKYKEVLQRFCDACKSDRLARAIGEGTKASAGKLSRSDVDS